ncbi:MAG: redoxin domain-containing protein [Planctomycetes bacterium]|nr:redoxin domain-containing protein [Planctomycetota bacterium]MCH8120815.1 redoxin domain-containing protein [Planctomycetota bacterium]
MIRELFLGDSLLWSCVWQSTIFLVVGLVSSFILRHRSSRAHQVLFLAMMAAVIVPVMSILVKHYELGMFVSEPVVIQSQAEDWVTASNYGASGVILAENIEHKPGLIEKNSPPAITGSESAKFPWHLVVLYGWIAASLILAARLLVTFVLGVRLLGRALPLDCQRIKEAAYLAKAKLGIDKDVMVRSSRGVHSPVIWCWRHRPVLLVPSAAGRFDNGLDWAGVLCHELAHWKRQDHISGLLAELVVCILPWHPLVWWAKSRLVRLSEQACDDWVVATVQPGTDYAESLLDLTPCGQMAFVPAVVHSRKGLAGRVRRILEDNCSNPQTGVVWALIVSLVVLCLTVGIAFAQTRPAVQPSAIQNIIVPTIGLAELENPNNVESNVIVLRLVDSDSRPVAGAKAGAGASTRDVPVLGSKLSWYLRSREHNISNDLGEITLTREKLFSPSWPADRKLALYVLHEDRRIGAVCEISKDGKQEEIELTLVPVCHVHGRLGSEGLKKIGRPLTWTNVYLQWNQDSFGVLSHTSDNQRFEFLVPPGEYQLMAYGSGGKGGKPPGITAATKHKRLTIEVKEGESDLDLGIIDLPPTKTSTLIGKPAIEFGPIKAWKNGPPVKLADLTGKAVIIYFNGSSPSTSRDLPRLVNLHKQFENKGLVIIALYNSASMEDLEKKWLEVYEKYGGVSDVPFRVAIDGGEPTFYEGTNKKRLGATYGAYDITGNPTTILIDPEGKVVGRLNFYKAKEILEEMLGVKPIPPALPTWRQRFDQVYRLDPQQVIKRISPPFIPERKDYYFDHAPDQARAIPDGPRMMTFSWDGKLDPNKGGFGSVRDLTEPLDLFGLESYEYEGPEELLSLKLPGDWIVRAGTTIEERMKALEELLAEELGRNIRFVKRTVEREVIVATGKFKFHPPSGTYESNSVHLFSDQVDPDERAGGGTADSVSDFLQRLGSRVKMSVIDKTKSSEQVRIPYLHHRSSRLRDVKDEVEKAKKLKTLLANLTDQTDLQFKVERQPAEIWFVMETKGN